jgi:hypothetical protein
VVPGTFFLDKNLSNGAWQLFEKKQLTPRRSVDKWNFTAKANRTCKSRRKEESTFDVSFVRLRTVGSSNLRFAGAFVVFSPVKHEFGIILWGKFSPKIKAQLFQWW